MDNAALYIMLCSLHLVLLIEVDDPVPISYGKLCWNVFYSVQYKLRDVLFIEKFLTYFLLRKRVEYLLGFKAMDRPDLNSVYYLNFCKI